MLKNFFFCSNNSFFCLPTNPFPFIQAFQVFKVMLSMVSWAHFHQSFKCVAAKIAVLVLCMTLWWSHLSKNYMGGMYHNLMESFFRLGFILFVVSEVMFFFGFFWSFFHSCWVPTIYIGAVWPPFDFMSMIEDAFSLSNTVILLSSAATVTVAHNSLLTENYQLVNSFIAFTCMLGMVFLFLQSKEYVSSSTSMNSTVFATTFFLLTGFHGLHVTVGLMFLMVTFFRFTQGYFSSQYHQGLTFAIWYWHFVDVVWLGLYGCVYHYSHLLYNV